MHKRPERLCEPHRPSLAERVGFDSRRELRALVGSGSRVPPARDSVPLPLRIPAGVHKRPEAGHKAPFPALAERVGFDSRRELRALVGRCSDVPQARHSVQLPFESLPGAQKAGTALRAAPAFLGGEGGIRTHVRLLSN